jgi:hypothetical protein
LNESLTCDIMNQLENDKIIDLLINRFSELLFFNVKITLFK